MTQAIILGDIHFGKSTNIGKIGIGAAINSRILDQMNLLDWVLDQAETHGVHDIIVTGDIFEEPKPSSMLITLFLSWIKKCIANNIKLHLIRGNHDILRSGFMSNSSLDIISEIDFDNVHVYKDIDTIIIGTTAFTLLPFRDRKSFSVSSNLEALSLLQDLISYELASIPLTYSKVLIGHLAIDGSIPVGDEIDDISNELFCDINMFNGYDYVWMGHVHKPQVMNKNNPYIAHVGSMDISNFGETDHKKNIVIFNCLNSTYEYKILPTRPLKKISIIVPKDVVDTTKFVIDYLVSLNDDYSKAIIKLEVSLDSEALSLNKPIIEKFFAEKSAFSISSFFESKKMMPVKKDIKNTIDTKIDVLSAIKTYAHTYVHADMRSEFIQLATETFTNFKIEAKD